MTVASPSSQELGEQFLKSLDKTHVGAAASKRFSASVGEIVMLLSRSPTHKHYSLADIEWMVLPAVMTDQFYIVEAAHKTNGLRVPIAFMAWAFVSDEIDRRLAAQDTGPRVRLRPDEWKSGEIAWLIDAVGSDEGVNIGLRWLKRASFKERDLKLIVRGADKAQVETLDHLISAAPEVRESR
jgi:cytolysin-activating lysine-acyltransferase